MTAQQLRTMLKISAKSPISAPQPLPARPLIYSTSTNHQIIKESSSGTVYSPPSAPRVTVQIKTLEPLALQFAMGRILHYFETIDSLLPTLRLRKPQKSRYFVEL